MHGEAVCTFVICDDILKLLDIRDDPQSQMSHSEVLAFTIIAARQFNGNHSRARLICSNLGYFPKMLSKSRLNRRAHSIPIYVWHSIFLFLSQVFRLKPSSMEFAVDSFPVASCKKSRIDKRKLFLGKKYIGYSASNKKYFCGVKVHMIVTIYGEPIEFLIAPASEGDLGTLWKMPLELPPGSTLYADGAYNSFELEDLLREDEAIELLARRRSDMIARSRAPEEQQFISSQRQIVETAFSCMTHLLGRSIRSNTESGFYIRLMSAIIAYSITL